VKRRDFIGIFSCKIMAGISLLVGHLISAGELQVNTDIRPMPSSFRLAFGSNHRNAPLVTMQSGSIPLWDWIRAPPTRNSPRWHDRAFRCCRAE
jgi:hypothetical protein